MAVSVLAPSLLSSEEIKSSLAGFIAADRILIRPIDLIACASDASFYRLIPKAVVQAQTLGRDSCTFCLQPGNSSAHDVSRRRYQPVGPVDFRRIAGRRGAPLARSDESKREAEKIRVQPGVIGARANQMLVPYGAKIGPDPASIATCTLGGILSNNSSGMCCGVEQNAYHTLHSMKFMLPSGNCH